MESAFYCTYNDTVPSPTRLPWLVVRAVWMSQTLQVSSVNYFLPFISFTFSNNEFFPFPLLYVLYPLNKEWILLSQPFCFNKYSNIELT